MVKGQTVVVTKHVGSLKPGDIGEIVKVHHERNRFIKGGPSITIYGVRSGSDRRARYGECRLGEIKPW